MCQYVDTSVPSTKNKNRIIEKRKSLLLLAPLSRKCMLKQAVLVGRQGQRDIVMSQREPTLLAR